MKRDSARPPSNFLLADYILTFSVQNAARRKELEMLCSEAWEGDEITAGTWEVSNDLSPQEMETKILEFVEEGDQAVYYYLTPPLETGTDKPPRRRIFRVVLA